MATSRSTQKTSAWRSAHAGLTKKLHYNNLIFHSMYMGTMVKWGEWQLVKYVDILWQWDTHTLKFSLVCCAFPNCFVPGRGVMGDIILNLLSPNVSEPVLNWLTGCPVHPVLFKKWLLEMNSVRSLVLGLLLLTHVCFDKCTGHTCMWRTAVRPTGGHTLWLPSVDESIYLIWWRTDLIPIFS